MLELTKQRTSQYTILTHVAAIIPPQVWLNEIMVDEQKNFRIRGQAATYSDLAFFLEKIEKESFFKNPVLVKAERDAMLSTMKFEITVEGKEM